MIYIQFPGGEIISFDRKSDISDIDAVLRGRSGLILFPRSNLSDTLENPPENKFYLSDGNSIESTAAYLSKKSPTVNAILKHPHYSLRKAAKSHIIKKYEKSPMSIRAILGITDSSNIIEGYKYSMSHDEWFNLVSGFLLMVDNTDATKVFLKIMENRDHYLPGNFRGPIDLEIASILANLMAFLSEISRYAFYFYPSLDKFRVDSLDEDMSGRLMISARPFLSRYGGSQLIEEIIEKSKGTRLEKYVIDLFDFVLEKKKEIKYSTTAMSLIILTLMAASGWSGSRGSAESKIERLSQRKISADLLSNMPTYLMKLAQIASEYDRNKQVQPDRGIDDLKKFILEYFRIASLPKEELLDGTGNLFGYPIYSPVLGALAMGCGHDSGMSINDIVIMSISAPDSILILSECAGGFDIRGAWEPVDKPIVSPVCDRCKLVKQCHEMISISGTRVSSPKLMPRITTYSPRNELYAMAAKGAAGLDEIMKRMEEDNAGPEKRGASGTKEEIS